MFQIKICGVRTVKDAELVAASGADAIGLNFYAKSRRFVRVDAARAICQHLGTRLIRVGVFVNAPVDEIGEIADRAGLDVIQLHGDEPPEIVAQLPAELGILRAHRMGQDGLPPLQNYLQACQAAGRLPDAALVDAYTPHEYGGTGETANWGELAKYEATVGSVPLIVAGGLTPSNVGTAIDQIRPVGVDTASGVESAPGAKDAELVREFCRTARAHLDKYLPPKGS